MAYDLLHMFVLMSLCKMSLCLKYNFISTRTSLPSERKDKHLNFLLLVLSTYLQVLTSGTQKEPLWGGQSHKRSQMPATAPPARGGRRAGEAQAPAPPAWRSSAAVPGGTRWRKNRRRHASWQGCTVGRRGGRQRRSSRVRQDEPFLACHFGAHQAERQKNNVREAGCEFSGLLGWFSWACLAVSSKETALSICFTHTIIASVSTWIPYS